MLNLQGFARFKSEKLLVKSEKLLVISSFKSEKLLVI